MGRNVIQWSGPALTLLVHDMVLFQPDLDSPCLADQFSSPGWVGCLKDQVDWCRGSDGLPLSPGVPASMRYEPKPAPSEGRSHRSRLETTGQGTINDDLRGPAGFKLTKCVAECDRDGRRTLPTSRARRMVGIMRSRSELAAKAKGNL